MSAPQVEWDPADPCEDAAVIGSRGYGVVKVNGRNARAHRVMWEAANGPLQPGEVVRHRCDRPSCIRLSHLEVGTQADNVRDRDERGRTATGMRNGRARWTDAQVAEMRSRVAGGESQASVAARFGANPATVSRVVRGLRRRFT